MRYRTAAEPKVHAQYVAETVRQLIYAQYGEETYSRGLNVYVTINANEQEVAYRALRKGLMDYERRQVYRGPEAYVDLPSNAKDIDVRIAEALTDHPDNDELLAAVVIEASSKRVVAVLQSGESITVTGDGLKPVASGLAERGPPKSRIRPGAVVRVVRGAKGDWSLTQQPEVEGAFVSMQPTDGQIRAMVGGFDFDKSKFNHVTQAWRQPGSSFKPFIYSAALEKGFTPLTTINDAPLFFDATATGSQPWEPKNYDGKFEGPMPLRQALAKSKNMVSIRILQAIGPAYAQDWITRFGFEAEKHPAFLTMALGAGAVTPLQMAGAYSVFANGGYRVNPVLVSRVTDSKGRVLQETKPQVFDASARVIDARNAFMMTQLLREVTRSGTAARAVRCGDPTSPARPAPPTIRSTPGSPATSPTSWPWSGSATTRRASWVTAKPAAAWRCRCGWSTCPRRSRRFRPAHCRRPKAWRCTAAIGCTRSSARALASPASAWKINCRRRHRAKTSARASSTCSSADLRSTACGPPAR